MTRFENGALVLCVTWHFVAPEAQYSCLAQVGQFKIERKLTVINN